MLLCRLCGPVNLTYLVKGYCRKCYAKMYRWEHHVEIKKRRLLGKSSDAASIPTIAELRKRATDKFFNRKP